MNDVKKTRACAVRFSRSHAELQKNTPCLRTSTVSDNTREMGVAIFLWINRCIRKTVLRTNHAIRWIFHSWKLICSIFYCVWFWPFSDNRLSYNILQNWVRVRLAAGLENSQFVLEFPEFCPQTYVHLYSLPWAYPHKRRPWCHPGVAIWVLLKLRRQVLI